MIFLKLFHLYVPLDIKKGIWIYKKDELIEQVYLDIWFIVKPCIL